MGEWEREREGEAEEPGERESGDDPASVWSSGEKNKSSHFGARRQLGHSEGAGRGLAGLLGP